MPEPFKLIFNPGLITCIADNFARVGPFDRATFLNAALNGLDELEMMQRSDQIAEALAIALPDDFLKALPSLHAVLHPDTEAELSDMISDETGLMGWALNPVGTYVARHGLDHPEQSLTFLAEMTQRATLDFAVRPFFRDHPDIALKHATQWARHPNHHVRRAASEGIRPRLPWGLRLARYVKDPTPILPILEQLKDDPSEYVRRSVANNLNDIAKDHPKLVSDIAANWMKNASTDRKRMVKHACRSLIKSGDPATLAVFGYGAPDGVAAQLSVSPDRITLGESLNIQLMLTAPSDLPVLIDVVMRFRKADGRLSPKVFKWSEQTLQANRPLILEKKFPLKPVTTRVHYAGEQQLAVQVNGVELAHQSFDLDLP